MCRICFTTPVQSISVSTFDCLRCLSSSSDARVAVPQRNLEGPESRAAATVSACMHGASGRQANVLRIRHEVAKGFPASLDEVPVQRVAELRRQLVDMCKNHGSENAHQSALEGVGIPHCG